MGMAPEPNREVMGFCVPGERTLVTFGYLTFVTFVKFPNVYKLYFKITVMFSALLQGSTPHSKTIARLGKHSWAFAAPDFCSPDSLVSVSGPP